MADDDRAIFQQMTSSFSGPAFIRRAKATEMAWEATLEACRRERERLLEMVKLRLALLAALLGDWSRLPGKVCPPAEADWLQTLHAEWRPKLKSRITPSSRRAPIARALHDLRESLQRFNERWEEYLNRVDLDRVNVLRDGYNRFYVMEKECALASPRVARLGFEPLPPVTRADLVREFPPLTPPQ